MTLEIVDIHPHIIPADPKKYPSNPATQDDESLVEGAAADLRNAG